MNDARARIMQDGYIRKSRHKSSLMKSHFKSFSFWRRSLILVRYNRHA